MSEPFRVGLTPDFRPHAPALEAALADVLAGMPWEFMADTGPSARAEVLDRYDGVIALSLRFPAESLTPLRRLAVIARWGVGYDRIDVAAATSSDVAIAIAPNAVRRPVAEGIVALIFALAKGLPQLDRLCRSGRWRDGLPRMIDLRGRTLGSVGAGNIGGELFRIARGIGFGRLLAFDPFLDTPPERVELVPLEEVLRESDFLSINCPLTARTRGLIGRRELELMKPTAFLVNTARGPIVDETALVEALVARRIAGAGLDVFEVEPIEASHPLLALDNVVVAPHAIAFTEELRRDCSYDACRSVRSVAEGRPPEHVANHEVTVRPGWQAKLARWRK